VAKKKTSQTRHQVLSQKAAVKRSGEAQRQAANAAMVRRGRPVKIAAPYSP